MDVITDEGLLNFSFNITETKTKKSKKESTNLEDLGLETGSFISSKYVKY